LEAGRADVRGGGARVKVGLMEGRRSSFEQSNLRSSSTPEKDTAEMVDDTLEAVVLELIRKEN
jgi:hypothetical protein